MTGRHQIKTHKVLLLNHAGEVHLRVLAAHIFDGTRRDEVEITLVLHSSLANRKLPLVLSQKAFNCRVDIGLRLQFYRAAWHGGEHYTGIVR